MLQEVFIILLTLLGPGALVGAKNIPVVVIVVALVVVVDVVCAGKLADVVETADVAVEAVIDLQLMA